MKTLRLVIFGFVAMVFVGAFAGSSSAAGQSSTSSTAKKKSKKKHSSKREKGQQAPMPDRISEIQSALAKGGYYQGDPSGKMDGDTVAALEKFQSAHGIDASGKLDAPTLQKLGLGSDIAGVSAPVHPQPAASPSTAPPSGASSPAPLPPSAANSASSISPSSTNPGSPLK